MAENMIIFSQTALFLYFTKSKVLLLLKVMRNKVLC